MKAKPTAVGAVTPWSLPTPTWMHASASVPLYVLAVLIRVPRRKHTSSLTMHVPKGTYAAGTGLFRWQPSTCHIIKSRNATRGAAHLLPYETAYYETTTRFVRNYFIMSGIMVPHREFFGILVSKGPANWELLHSSGGN
ncbi:uncharacterized protein BDZ83DRAFT_733916 [Colletotrichum acutatum]|uniref:Uncharacterized protein n=1 Tax=Glomerella acutata TaxID=27357 RepID=A0AAD8UD29_GLOAC|nr:uncharacterized protein BDZ83DRAFT_733916 [Colletotrichum acutatum]KAK1716867.1 hypothetical protein BDZ83DRAFT_733916 [Colletotrichum acutatum]